MGRLAWQKFQSWWLSRQGQERFVWLSMALATIGGASLRLANFYGGLQYLADQGRDVIVAYGILHGDVALVGPSTSVGDMFLGPLYYYFMAPFLWLAGYDPAGPAIAMALLGIITIPAVYWVGSRLVGRAPAFLAALLYASAPVVIEYTRFSWNPNPAPIVTLALLYCTWRAWRGSAWWWAGAAVALVVISQLHYVALLAAFPAGVYWLADVIRSLRSERNRFESLAKATGVSVVIVLASFLPLVLFNWRFNNIILKGFIDFFNGDQESGGANAPLSMSILRSVRETQGRALQGLFEIWGQEWGPRYRQINSSLLTGYVVVLAASLRSFWQSRYRHGYMLLLLSLIGTVVGLSWYRSSVFFHYLSFFFPVAYLLTGIVAVQLYRWFKWIGFAAAAVLLSYVFWLSARPENMRYLQPLGWQVGDVERISEQILTELPPETTYALTELSDVRDYRGLVYRYFLVKSAHPPVPLENFADADVLVVVAQNPQEPNEVLGSPVYEIAAFPKGEYRRIQTEDGPSLYLIQRQGVVE